MERPLSYEIGVIIVLVLAIILVHSVPIIANFEKPPWVDTLEETITEFREPLKETITELEFKDRKYYNVLTDEQLSIIHDLLNKENEPNEENPIRQGEPASVYSNKELEEFLINILGLGIYNTINVVKVSDGHKLKEGKLEVMHNFNSSLKKAKKVWYFFPHDWEIDNWWMLKLSETNRYFVPEKNSIIEFKADEHYEWLPLKSEEEKYFVIIVKF